ncbi:MAG: clan AA aspartic protease [Pyrinomonadaceae bacterium]|nr:clan AA aspartic protease [Pyrinomonadaceae bacterium]
MLLPTDKRSSEEIPKVVSPTGGSKMGLVYAEIELVSTEDLMRHRRGSLSENKIKRMRIRAMVDSGAYMLVITDHIRQQLDLPLIQEQVFRLADDSEIRGEVVGPVEIQFENRSTTVRAVVLPGAEEPLLGSIPLEDLDVVIDPKQQRLIVNPKSPDIATKYLK